MTSIFSADLPAPAGARAVVGTLCALSFLSSVPAVSGAPGLPKPASEKVVPGSNTSVGVGGDYVLGPDDVVTITVLKHPEFSAQHVMIPGMGVINLPVVGAVRAAGKTLGQLDAEITNRMKVRLIRPEVVVTLEKPRPRPLYVVGHVRSPGVVEFKNGWKVAEALAAAGGLVTTVDLIGVSVVRNNRKIADSPLSPILQDPSDPRNVTLQVGDTLRFYQAAVTVKVSGAVAKPGDISVPRNGGVVEAIGLAGGPTEAASLSRASVRRINGQIIDVDLFKALRQGDKTQNVPLHEGDLIILPEYKDRVSVVGAVKTPGVYGVEDGRQTLVSDVVARAGGPTNSAALTKAFVRKSNGEIRNVNLFEILVQGKREGNEPLEANDVVTIPESRGVTVLGQVRNSATYRIEEGTAPRVSDALALAGGVTSKPENVRISLSRQLSPEKTITLNVDPVGLLELRDASQNTRVLDGDVISVSEVKKATVFINGEVKLPGAYEMEEGDSIPELIARAGGPTDDASLTQVSLTRRNGQQETVDVLSALKRGAQKVNIQFNAGDLVVVPRSTRRVLVIGATNKPGSYAIPEDRPFTIGDALSAAGGPRNLAKLKQIALMRQTNSGVEKKILAVDRVEGNNLSVNLPVETGDVIYVPEGRLNNNSWGPIAAIASAVGSFIP